MADTPTNGRRGPTWDTIFKVVMVLITVLVIPGIILVGSVALPLARGDTLEFLTKKLPGFVTRTEEYIGRTGQWNAPDAEIDRLKMENMMLRELLVERVRTDEQIAMIYAEMAKLPPDDWQRRIESNAKEIHKMELQVQRLAGVQDR